MDILKKISSLFSTPDDSGAYWIEVKCRRCGETIRSRVNLNNDLSVNYGDDGKTTYYCRKVLMGQERCFQRLEVELTFNENKRLIDRQISGGSFLDGS
jgi:hypothetical protein